MDRRRLLLIGVDAAEWQLVERFVADGRMPTVCRLLATGTRASLTTPSAQFPDTAWTAIHAGANPARTNKYFDLQYVAETQELVELDDDAIRNRPFWEYLSEAGLRVGVLDAPKFSLSDELNGFQVGNWGACSTKTARGATPASLLAEIDSRFPRHPVDSCDSFASTPDGHRELFAGLLEGIRTRGELAGWLLEREPCDVTFVAFSETHCAGHHLWRYFDPSHHLYETGDPFGLADAMGQVYEAIDREIGELIARAGDDVTTLVFSSQGMGPLRHASGCMAQLVELMGFGAPGTAAAGQRVAKPNIVQRVKKRMSIPLQLRIKSALPLWLQDRIHVFGYTGTRRWQKARAFAVPNTNSVGAIRINVKGRDRFGCVEPGPPFEALCTEIAEALREVCDVETGRPVLARVTVVREQFDGPNVDSLPDLTAAWDQSFDWTCLRSPRFGELQVEPPEGRSGSHTPLGFVVFNGAEIAANAVLPRPSTYQIAPTVLALAGAPRCPEFEPPIDLSDVVQKTRGGAG